MSTISDAPVVAVLGATGLVGSMLLQILEERKFPIRALKCLASAKSIGQVITFAGEQITVELACPEAFDGVDIVLASAGASVSAQLVPEAVKRGAVVVDNTSFYRMNDQVPLVVAGVNDADIAAHQGIIANPNCSTAQLMPVLKALDNAFGLRRVIISTYQSVSGAGKNGMDGLLASTRSQQDVPGPVQTHAPFQRPIGFNLIPHIDSFLEEGPLAGYTKEEAKLINETKKILHRPHLAITATAIRVPVMVGHSESVTIETQEPITPEAAIRVLQTVADVVVGVKATDYHTPLETANTDPVYVSRIRSDSSNPTHGLNMWVVADNLRIGAALNAVRIAERLLPLTQTNIAMMH